MNQTKVCLKLHRTGTSEVLAVCDKKYIGQTLHNTKIKMKVHKSFYEGNEIPIQDAFSLFKSYGNINAVGSVINYGIQRGEINKNSVLWLENEEGESIPHMILFKMPPL